MATKQTVVADICLYGAGAVGAGWLARTQDGQMFGTGEPHAGRTMTSATWLACDALCSAGVSGLVRIFEPNGAMMATVSLAGLKHRALPYFGDLKWTAAPVYALSVTAVR